MEFTTKQLKKIQAKAAQQVKSKSKVGKDSSVFKGERSPFLILDDYKTEQRRKAEQAARVNGQSRSLDTYNIIESTRSAHANSRRWC